MKNIVLLVAWVPSQQLLFGGCLVKSLDARNLGNVGEADLINWPATLQKISVANVNAKIVITGHGEAGGLELVRHTLTLHMKHQESNMAASGDGS